MYTPSAPRAAAVAGLLLISIQTAFCLPPGAPAITSPVSAEGIAIRDRAEQLRNQGRLREAERLLNDFATLHANDAPSPLLAHIYNDLATLQQDQHRFTEANRWYRRSVEEWQRSGPKYRLHAATVLNNLAILLWDDGRVSESYKTLVQSAAIQIDIAGPFSPGLLQLYYNQGVLSMALNRFAEAEQDYQKFLRVTNPTIDAPYLLRAALVNSDLGLIARQDGRTDEATRHFAQSRQLWNQYRAEHSTAPGEPDGDPVPLLNLATSFWKAGSIREAEAAVEMALSSMEPAAHARLVRALELKARILRTIKRKAEARAAELRAREVQLQHKDTRAATEDRIDIAALQSVTASRREPRR